MRVRGKAVKTPLMAPFDAESGATYRVPLRQSFVPKAPVAGGQA